MSNEARMRAGVGVFGAMAIAALMGAQVNAQQAPTGDFTNAAMAEVRNAQGHVLLRGQFVAAEEDDDDVERKAILEPVAADANARGEAEVEFSRTSAAEQEIEFSVRNLPAGVTLTFVIDGVDVGTATTNQRGRAELELEVRMPGTSGSR